MTMRPGLLVLCALAALGVRGASAQDERTAPIILLVPGGTRAMGLGDAFVAGSGPEAVFYNPAQAGVGRGTTLSFQRYGAGSTLGSIATNGSLVGAYAYALGVQFLDFSTAFDTPTRPADLTHRGPVDANSLAATVAVSATWQGIRWGAGATYASVRLEDGTSSVAAVNLGASKRITQGITVGLAGQDIGGDILVSGRRVPVPSRVTLGATTPDIFLATFFDIAGSLAVTRDRDGKIVPGGGVEVTYNPVSGVSMAGRVGVRRVPSGPDPVESPITFGASFGLDRLSLDLAWEPGRGDAGSTERIGLWIRP